MNKKGETKMKTKLITSNERKYDGKQRSLLVLTRNSDAKPISLPVMRRKYDGKEKSFQFLKESKMENKAHYQ